MLQLGVEHAYVSYYTDTDQRELECLVAIRDANRYDPPLRRFAADHLVPAGSVPTSRRATFLVFPLAFHARNLGVAIFEFRKRVGGYPIVRDQISGVLHCIALHQEILKQITLNERRAQEQERQATANRIQALSVLAGGVAHDLNNVLGPVVALPDLMTSELYRLTLPVELAETNLASDLDTIKTAALRATQTIKDVLTLGRQGHATREPLDLNRAVSRFLTDEVLRTGQPDVRVTVELCKEPLYIVGSEAHIGRAITNLVRNAAEAIDGDGEVAVRTQALTLFEPISGCETIERGTYAAITVADTGQGISPNDIGRLFEPFYTKKRLGDHSGSGLGLAIVHGVIKEHGGFIDVESVIGRGTTFTLYLPRGQGTEEARAPASAPPRGDAKILVVDDEPLQLRTCRRVLPHLGYSVDTLRTSSEVIEPFAEHAENAETGAHETPQSPYDLVILDMVLDGDEEGLSLFDKIRAICPRQRAIIASGHAPSQVVALAGKRGLAWLAKPYTQNTLARAVHVALAHVADPTEHARRRSSSTPPSVRL